MVLPANNTQDLVKFLKYEEIFYPALLGQFFNAMYFYCHMTVMGIEEQLFAAEEAVCTTCSLTMLWYVTIMVTCHKKEMLCKLL